MFKSRRSLIRTNNLRAAFTVALLLALAVLVIYVHRSSAAGGKGGIDTTFKASGDTAMQTLTPTITPPPSCTPVNFNVGRSDFNVGTNPVPVVVGDFNGDGKPDLATANWGSLNVSIVLGTGTGSFGAATNFGVGSTRAQAIAVGDFNGDGKLDLVTANSSNQVSILLGTGTGSFGAATNFTAGDYPESVTTGDFNGDGKLDLAAANSESNDVSILL